MKALTEEQINNRLNYSLGEPDDSVEDHTYQIRPLNKEWWLFHNGVGSGEPLSQWLRSELLALQGEREDGTSVNKELFPCPYSKAVKCTLNDPCYGCETLGRMRAGEETPRFEEPKEVTDEEIEKWGKEFILSKMPHSNQRLIAKQWIILGAKAMRDGKIK